MSSFSKILIMGYLGGDPEMQPTQGKPLCHLNIATNEKYKDQTWTTWFKVKVWGTQAEVAQRFLAKGSRVYIEGQLRSQEWQDKQGKKHTSWEVHASSLKVIDFKDTDPKGTDSKEDLDFL